MNQFFSVHEEQRRLDRERKLLREDQEVLEALREENRYRFWLCQYWVSRSLVCLIPLVLGITISNTFWRYLDLHLLERTITIVFTVCGTVGSFMTWGLVRNYRYFANFKTSDGEAFDGGLKGYYRYLQHLRTPGVRRPETRGERFRRLSRTEEERKQKLAFFEKLDNDRDFREAWMKDLSGIKEVE